MNQKIYLLLLASLLLGACRPSSDMKKDLSSTASAKGTALFTDDWENIAANYHFPEWFQDAKFGIFIHWGIYSVPAYGSEWYARNMYQKESPEYNFHREKYGDQTKFGYKDFIPQFTGERFNSEEWAALFKASGAKYVVPVAEHHDGFSMYDSKLNPWNSVRMGPRKDIVGLLKQSVEKNGLVFGLSTHRAENAWFYGGGMHFPSDVQDTTITLYGERLEREQVNEKFMEEWLAHTHELIDKYQPQLIWFDWTVNNPGVMPTFNKFMAYYYNTAIDWNKGVVVNTKYGYPKNIQVWDIERGKSNRMKRYPWQTDTSVGKKSWSYIDNEENKTPEQIVHDLVDIVSKNGNLLLNIGPKVDGTITPEQQEVLRGVGRWLSVNGEAIYGTRTWARAAEGEVGGNSGAFSDSDATPYTANDIRFTTKKGDLYATCLGWTTGKVLIRTLGNTSAKDVHVKQVGLLGSNEKIDWRLTDEGLEIQFPKNKPCEYAYSFKIELSGFIAGETSFTTNEKGELEISEYMYLHEGKGETKSIEVLVNGKKQVVLSCEVDPYTRVEFVHTASEFPEGSVEIGLSVDGLKTETHHTLFPALDWANGWKFKKGDDLFRKLVRADSTWEAVVLPNAWETHSNYNVDKVYGWYQKDITIPQSWKRYKLLLPLGCIDDAAEIFFNGVSIGKSGEFPPHFQSAFNRPVEVILPAHLIKYGRENLLSIRVYDELGSGGLVGGPIGPVISSLPQ